MPVPKSMYLFYQNGRMTTEFDGLKTRSIFQHKGTLLVQRTSGAEAANSILAVNSSNTVMTERGKTRMEQFPYTPYGRRPSQSELNNPLAFNGEQLNSATGCYFLGNGYRAYSPTLARFASPDNLSPFNNGGLNAYVYCAGDPINNTDPTGHFGLPSRALIHYIMFATTTIVDTLAVALSVVGHVKDSDVLKDAGLGLAGLGLAASGAWFAMSRLQGRTTGTRPNAAGASQSISRPAVEAVEQDQPPAYDTFIKNRNDYPRPKPPSPTNNESATAMPPSFSEAMKALASKNSNRPVQNLQEFAMTELVNGKMQRARISN